MEGRDLIPNAHKGRPSNELVSSTILGSTNIKYVSRLIAFGCNLESKNSLLLSLYKSKVKQTYLPTPYIRWSIYCMKLYNSYVND